jgi:hypothetical protein
MTKAVRNVLRKKNVFALLGKRFARALQVNRIKYSRNNAVRPKEALRFVRPRCFRMLMTTLYVGSRVEKPVIPIRAGTCPTAMLMAEPVMKADIAGSDIRSTIHPSLAKPKKRTIAPEMMAREDATISLGTPGSLSSAFKMTDPVTVERTATGPMVISLEVAKNQYIRTPMNDEYSPNSTGSSASLAYAILWGTTTAPTVIPGQFSVHSWIR